MRNTNQHLKNPPRAFTLIELLAALVLLTLLMTSVMGMIPQYVKSAKQLGTTQTPQWIIHLQEILAHDLQQSRAMQLTTNGLELFCPPVTSSNNSSAERRVYYRWQKVNQQQLFMRITSERSQILAFEPVVIEFTPWRADASTEITTLTLSPAALPTKDIQTRSRPESQTPVHTRKISPEITPHAVQLTLKKPQHTEALISATVFCHTCSSMNSADEAPRPASPATPPPNTNRLPRSRP